jgi:hypothetical protein
LLSCGEILIPACDSSINDLKKKENAPTFNMQSNVKKNSHVKWEYK